MSRRGADRVFSAGIWFVPEKKERFLCNFLLPSIGLLFWILDENSKQSHDLLMRLSSCKIDSTKSSEDGAVNSLTALGQSLDDANRFRDKLLMADKSEEVTRVYDLANDYWNLEMNQFLTSEERNSIVKRKEELKELNAANKRRFVFNLDLENKSFDEQKQKDDLETVEDPILQSIIMRSMLRSQKSREVDIQAMDDSKRRYYAYNPRYHSELSKEDWTKHKNQMTIEECKRPILCIGLKQPFASMLIDEGSKFRYIPWKKKVSYKGPVVIAALDESQQISSFNDCLQNSNKSCTNYPTRSLIGRGILRECITGHEYNSECTEMAELFPIKHGFVLQLSDTEPLPKFVPYTCPSELFELESEDTRKINEILVADSLYDECDIALL